MDETKELERRRLLTNLLDAVKKCQLKFNEKRRLATESDENVKSLCSSFENVFEHGLKDVTHSSLKQLTDATGLLKLTSILLPADTIKDFQKLSFWNVLEEHLSHHELERFNSLKNIKTDLGKVRAWFRSALNEHSLEKYMHSIINHGGILRSKYERWSFMLDDEKAVTLPNLAAGLSTILFAFKIDKSELEVTTSTINIPEQMQEIENLRINSNVRSKRKKKQAKVINFDEPANIMEGDSEVDWKFNPDEEFGLTCKSSKHSRSTFDDIISPNVPSDCSGHQNSDSFSFEYDQLSCCSPTNGYKEESYTSLSKSESNLKDMGQSKDDKMSRLSSLYKNDTQSDSISDDFLRPVNSDGQIIDIGVFKLMDPDTTSESYGSFDSQDMIDSEVLKQPIQNGTGNSQPRASRSTMPECNTGNQCPASEDCIEGTPVQSLVMDHSPKSLFICEDQILKSTPKDDSHKHLEERLSSLERENSFLKDQMKNYIDAMRTLELKNHSPNAPKYESVTSEVKEYEQKLVQIAEMHAELMEFNEMILKKLTQKEIQLEHAMRELSRLNRSQRGSTTGPKKSNVNVIIPSAFLHGSPPNSYHVYQIYIRIRNEEWNVYRRYTEFYELHCLLKKALKNIRNLDFPPKRAFRKKDPKLVEVRRRKLEDYLKKAIGIIAEAYPQVFGNLSRRTLMAVLPFFDNEAKLWDNSGHCILRLHLSNETSNQSYSGL